MIFGVGVMAFRTDLRCLFLGRESFQHKVIIQCRVYVVCVKPNDKDRSDFGEYTLEDYI